METLHEIGQDEQFLAQGEYDYQLAGKKSGLAESWSLHRLANGPYIHRATVGGRISTMRIRQLSHFVFSPQYRPNRLEMRQEIDGDTTHTTIICHPTQVEQTIIREDGSDQRVVDVPAGYALFFPPVSTQGFVTQSYDAQAGGRQPLSLVSVRVQPENALPLAIDVQTIDYEQVDQPEEVETPAGQFRCRHFIRYDHHMEQHLWFDDLLTVLQWSVPYSPIMKWEYLLTRYQRER
jgi:hypothetical protein